jgi:hypothetical protein
VYLRKSSGNLAILTAIRRASSRIRFSTHVAIFGQKYVSMRQEPGCRLPRLPLSLLLGL